MKSRTASLILTVLFGPLGLLYASKVGALVLTLAAIVTAPTVIGPLLCWFGAVIWGDTAAQKSAPVEAEAVDPRQWTGYDREPKPDKKEPLISPGDLLAYGLIIVAIFVVPHLLGKPPEQSAIVFYVDLLKG